MFALYQVFSRVPEYSSGLNSSVFLCKLFCLVRFFQRNWLFTRFTHLVSKNCDDSSLVETANMMPDTHNNYNNNFICFICRMLFYSSQNCLHANSISVLVISFNQKIFPNSMFFDIPLDSVLFSIQRLYYISSVQNNLK
jgi:hypothetical protein